MQYVVIGMILLSAIPFTSFPCIGCFSACDKSLSSFKLYDLTQGNSGGYFDNIGTLYNPKIINFCNAIFRIFLTILTISRLQLLGQFERKVVSKNKVDILLNQTSFEFHKFSFEKIAIEIKKRIFVFKKLLFIVNPNFFLNRFL